MLSVLVPVYNWRVEPFIASLARAAEHGSDLPVEILVLDDGSEEAFKKENAILSNIRGVTYHELEQNVGRSAIRNKLASMASGEWLLFLDCDGAPVPEDFLSRYASSFAQSDVVVGGRTYSAKRPCQDRMLHYLYGSDREQRSANERAQHPYASFMTNNFAIRKVLFLSIGLDESLTGYGHEDTLLGVELKKKHARMKHIDAPVRHDDVETNSEFLNKTDQGLKNLARLHERGAIADEVRVLRAAIKARKWGLLPLIRLRYGNKEKLRTKLSAGQVNLRDFDIYKLLTLADLL